MPLIPPRWPRCGRCGRWASSAATAQEARRALAAVGAAGQDDRHPGAEHDAGGVGVGEEGQFLGQHVAGLDVGHQQDVGVAGDRRDDALGLPRPRALIALSKASGPSSMPPVIWPRSAILHRAAASMVEGIFAVTVSTARRIATFGRSTPSAWASSMAFCDDVDLVLQRRARC